MLKISTKIIQGYYQEAGDNEQAIYDDTVYLLTVYVTNDEHGGNELKTQWVLRRDGSEAKQDAIFTNGNFAHGEPTARSNRATRAPGLEPPPRTKRATAALKQ